MLLHSCWPLQPMICGFLLHVLTWQSSNGETYWGHVCQGLPIQCCCTATLHLTNFCWQMQLGRGSHCLASYHVHNSLLPLLAVIHLQDQHQIHEFQGISICIHHKISCRHVAKLASWFCYTGPSPSCSMTTQPSLMQVSMTVHRPQQSLVKTYLGPWGYWGMTAIFSFTWVVVYFLAPVLF